MIPIRSNLHRLSWTLPTLAVALMMLALTSQADGLATFTVDGRLDESAPERLEVTLQCRLTVGGETLTSLRGWLPRDGTTVFEVMIPPGETAECSVAADAPDGLEVRYRGDGGSSVDIGAERCRFSNVQAGHANFCQLQGQSRGTSITVYKKWIGARDREPDVSIDLFCDGQRVPGARDVNSGIPARWSLEVSNPDGVVCDVVETERDDFVPDASECQGLVVLPGSEEECTLVNTKVVKMIDMLNRYGLAIMILVFMAVGMFAARRFVP